MKKCLITLLLILLTVPAYSAHITDKLLAGLYSTADATTEPLKVLPSGTPVEILEKKKGYTKVRTGDDTVGWIENSYITIEKPAKVMLLELQARTSGLQQQLSAAQKELKQLKAGQGSAPAAPAPEQGQALKDAKAEIKQLNTELAGTRTKLEQALKESGGRPQGELEAENRALKIRISQAAAALGMEPSTSTAPSNGGYRFEAWHLLVLGVIILISFISGIAYKNFRIAKRYGGFRI
ncbi:MAG: TIGR04211 family SH3 domain-containing protein [Candidatus Sedimenticola sp. PURPLELP]